MSKVANSLVEQRARVLAMVQFTTRSDLQVDDLSEENGFDLFVRITSDGEVRQFLKAFGVELKGTNRALRGVDDAVRYLKGGSSRKPKQPLPKYSFPVVVLIFSMEDDKGYYAWRAEPSISRLTEPRLHIHEFPTCNNFDREALGVIVDRVGEWYDKLFDLFGAA